MRHDEDLREPLVRRQGSQVSTRGILRARILEWIAISSPGDLPDPGIKPGSPALPADSLPAEPLGTFI